MAAYGTVSPVFTDDLAAPEVEWIVLHVVLG